jgi:ketosteroid isomerase-like protein
MDSEVFWVILVIGLAVLVIALALLAVSYVGMLIIIVIDFFARAFSWVGVENPTIAWMLLGFLVGGIIGLFHGLRRAGRTSDGPKIYAGAVAVVLVLVIASASVESVSTSTAPPPSETRRAPTPTTPPPSSPARPLPSEPVVNVAANQTLIKALLDGWIAATKEKNADRVMNCFADTVVPYYGRAGGVSADKVRADFERAFSSYSTIDTHLGDIEIQLDGSGNSAEATFKKSFDFEGDKYFKGEVQEKLWLTKINGNWRISGMKDAQLYWKDSGTLSASQNSAGTTASPPDRARPPADGTTARATEVQQQAAMHISKAQELFAQNEYEAAIAECNRALKLDRRNQEAIQLRAKIKKALEILNGQQ